MPPPPEQGRWTRMYQLILVVGERWSGPQSSEWGTNVQYILMVNESIVEVMLC